MIHPLMWLLRTDLFQEFQDLLNQGFPLICLYGLPGSGKKTFARQLLLKFLKDESCEADCASILLSGGEQKVGIALDLKELPLEEELQELHSVSKTLVFISAKRPAGTRNRWMASLHVSPLDASQSFALARNYLPDLSGFTLKRREEFLSLCCGHAELIQIYLSEFRERIGTHFQPPADQIQSRRHFICSQALKEISTGAHEALKNLAFWDLPATFGEGLKFLLPQPREEIFIELKNHGLLECSSQKEWKIHPLLRQFLIHEESDQGTDIREKLLKLSEGIENPSIFQERLAQGIHLGRFSEEDIKSVFCSHAGVQNPSRFLNALNHCPEKNSPWPSLLKGRIFYEYGNAAKALDYLQVPENLSKIEIAWIQSFRAKTILFQGDPNTAKSILEEILSQSPGAELEAACLSTLASCHLSQQNFESSKKYLLEASRISQQMGYTDLYGLLLVNQNISSSPESQTEQETRQEILSSNPHLFSANQTKLFYRKTEILILEGHLEEGFEQVHSLLVQATNRHEHQKLGHAFLYAGIIYFLRERMDESLWCFQHSTEFFEITKDTSRSRLTCFLSILCQVLAQDWKQTRALLGDLEHKFKAPRNHFLHSLIERMQGRSPRWPEIHQLQPWEQELYHMLSHLEPPLCWPCFSEGVGPKELLNLILVHFSKKIRDAMVYVRWDQGGAVLIPSKMVQTGSRDKDQYDIVLNLVTEEFWEKSRGELKMSRKRNLLALFMAFLNRPSQYLSSEYLYRTLWEKPFDSEVDEPVVRMAINRLKKEIEPKSTEKHYIARHLMEPSYCLLPSKRCLLVCTLKDYYELLERVWKA